MRTLVVLILAALLAVVPFAVCYADGDAEDTAEATSTAEDVAIEDVTDDWEASIKLRSGVLWNVDREEWTGYVAFPFLKYRDVWFEAGFEVNPNEKEGKTAILGAVTYDVGTLRDFGIDVSWAEHFGVNVGPFLRYDLLTGELQKGLLTSVVDLSIGDE